MLATEHNELLISSMLEKLRAKAGEDCIKFILAYGAMIELYDDYVDKDKGEISIHTIKNALVDLFSSEYWRKNQPYLYITEKLIHLTFADVVKWEESNITWKREHAKVLSHCGYNMLYGIIILELGIEEAMRFSEEHRTTCHELHNGDVI
jgi:hypothetical protein